MAMAIGLMDDNISNTKSVPLALKGISKSFGSVRALAPLDLEIRAGEMVALLGPSGCGKTTTLRIISGFELPDTGSVMVGNADITNVPPHKRSLGMVFQNYSLFPHMTVAENIMFGLNVRGHNRATREQRVREMLSLVRLSGFEDRAIKQLSGGQQQRVALARSLVTDPSVLLLDEPLGALDKSLRERMQFELREIQGRLGITSIIVTHDQEEALTMSDRVAVMNDGNIVQIASPSEIYERPKTRFVSEFLGTANIFEGTVTGNSAGGECGVRIENGVRDCYLDGSSRMQQGQTIELAVRPERMAVVGKEEAILIATYRGAVFRGSYYAYEFELPGQPRPVFVHTSASIDVPSDKRVGISWPSQHCIVLDRADA